MRIKSYLQQPGRQRDLVIALVTMILALLIRLASANFLSPFNVFNVTRTAALYAAIALGQTMALSVGCINLSIGAISELSVITLGGCLDSMQWPIWVSVLLALMVGGLCGLINGSLIVCLRLDSIVVTLATSFVFSGLVVAFSHGVSFTGIPNAYTLIGKSGFLGLPYLIWFMILILSGVRYFFHMTTTGVRMLATGSNAVSARLSGIRTKRMVMLGNILSGVFTALATVLWVCRLGSASPGNGEDWMMISFAVAAISGTSLTGGRVRCMGIFIAALMVSLLKNGLIMIGVDMYYEQTFLGVLILFAGGLGSIFVRKSTRE